MAFTCPRCGRASHHPEDAAVPGEALARSYQCEGCGQRRAVLARNGTTSPGSWGEFSAYVASGLVSLSQLVLEVSGYACEDTAALVTGSQRNAGTDWGDCPRTPPEVDDTPWFDSMEWSPGDAEL